MTITRIAFQNRERRLVEAPVPGLRLLGGGL
jgi:hypothetical protein